MLSQSKKEIMSFEKAGDFLIQAAKKYNLSSRASASLVCERVKKVFQSRFPRESVHWNPQKFVNGVLFVAAQNSTASSALFMRTHELLELFASMPEHFSVKIREIRIVRNTD